MRKVLYVTILASTLSLSAQNLKTEITSDRTIVPRQESSTPLQSVQPAILGSDVPTVQLNPDNLSDIPPFDPRPGFSAPIAPSLPSGSPYRGYVLAGYLPAHNYDFMAGYSFLETKTTSLDARIGLGGFSYKGWELDGHKTSLVRPAADLNFFHAFSGTMTLDANAGVTYDHLSSNPRFGDEHHNITRGWLNSTLTDGRLSLKMNISHIDATDALRSYPSAYTSVFMLDGFLKPKTATGWDAGMSAALQVRRGWAPFDEGFLRQTAGIIGLRPGYNLLLGPAHLRVGAKVDISMGGDDSGLHVAPDVRLTMSPLNRLHLELDITGGEQFNSLERCYGYSPFAVDGYMFRNSYTPVDARLSLTFGPWDWGKLKVFGRYSRTNEVPMPMAVRGLMTWEAVDLSALTGGVEAEAKMMDIVKLTGGLELTPAGYTRGTAENIDRASVVLKLDATAAVTKEINAGIGYNLRGARHFYYTNPGEFGSYNPGSISDLHLHADWQIQEPLTLFFNLENILNKRSEIIPGLKIQGIHGLVGAIYRF